MTTDNSAKLEEWIKKIQKIDASAAKYLLNNKWSKAINMLYDHANFGFLTSETEFKEKRNIAVTIYQLSRDIRNTKGKGLALSLLARHLIKDQEYELAFRFLLLTKHLLSNGMEWVGVKEVFYLIPENTLDELENRRASFNDDPEVLVNLFIEKYNT